MGRNSGLIIALVIAGLFGAVILWFAVYYLHRYIHRSCLELDYWFHLLTPPQWRSEPRNHDYGREMGHRCGAKRKSRSRSRHGRWDRERDEYSRSRRWCRSPQDQEEAACTSAKYAERPKPALTMPVYGEQCYPAMGWQQHAPAGGQMAYPPIAYQQPFPLYAAPVVPGPMPQQYLPPTAVPVPQPATYAPVRRKRPAETHPVEKGSQPPGPRRFETDFIHICDEYPPIILEKLKKAAPPLQSSSSSSSSSSDDATTQEIPRRYIPHSAPRFADPPPFQFPQYPHSSTRAWDVPTSYPRQWMNTGGERLHTGQARYAPYTRNSGMGQNLRNMYADGRRQAPNHDIPRSRMWGRWGQQAPRPQRAYTECDPRQKERGHAETVEQSSADEAEQEPAEKPKNIQSENGNESDGLPEHVSEGGKSPKAQLMDPMPIPVVEEPSSETDK
ncbi:hypothetical protein P153DRAFT_399696 [Dothidotthia symphoricarpi CBS 119687]|uniref:Uncharacterized protein n=1 Tax=Dothidotthia symphoricarpi CBS 119687 TaxID=1392245 RepID=A0A6A6A500_9PLEO|nr:uncharacterized protein P153DRAFT_399696 [Dothidotthia symphoricarpi CBS 119687]KAF2126243.1 hypothetical protein P153DRAFT_399696 [Dothidotthia symphoricarpi CBS 119687]